jgi:F-type H+-transporting ATPase subunit a
MFDITPLFQLGPLGISATVVTTWVVTAVVWLLCWRFSHHLRDEPGALQTAVERIVITIEETIDRVAPAQGRHIMPFVGTLWIFLVIANLVGLIPGAHSPTRDLSATAALAFLVFLSTHWYGVQIQGWKRYLHHYLSPSPILLPFHLVGEITRTIALAVRLFGNIMSLEMAALLILLVAGFLAPVPILMLHIIEALVQAYIFGMLALIYVAGGIQSQQHLSLKEGDNHA